MKNFWKILGGFLMFWASQLQSQDKLQPTDNQSLIDVVVMSFELVPYPNETLIFTNTSTGKSIQKQTNQQGKCQVLLDEGYTYSVKYKSLGSEYEYEKIEIPKVDGAVSYNLELKYRPPQKFELKNVFFETGKSALKSSSFPALDELARALNAKPSVEIEISGHTDNVGDDAYNQKLSLARARAVRNYLVSKKNISANRITAKGYGASQPVADNNTEEGRKQNRRTEVKILKE